MSANERKDAGSAPAQQQGGTGSGQQAQQSGEGQQYGEGNYKATRDYNAGLKKHMDEHDVEKEARDAAPRSEEEARQMQEAERVGRSKAKGAGENARGEDGRGMGDAGVPRQGE